MGESINGSREKRLEPQIQAFWDSSQLCSSNGEAVIYPGSIWDTPTSLQRLPRTDFESEVRLEGLCLPGAIGKTASLSLRGEAFKAPNFPSEDARGDEGRRSRGAQNKAPQKPDLSSKARFPPSMNS